MAYDDLAVIILAAGKGTRMKSALAKVLHKVADKSMVVHVIESARRVAPDHIHVVVGHQAERVKEEISHHVQVKYSLQKALLGTGDAVKSALGDIDPGIEHVLVLCGDVPLIETQTLDTLLKGHVEKSSTVTVLAALVEDPHGYGRIITDPDGRVIAIREQADASEAEKKINTVNTGIFCFNRHFLDIGIKEIQPDNNQAEYYLTDLVEIAQKQSETIIAVTMDDPSQVMGVNTLQELEKANKIIRNR